MCAATAVKWLRLRIIYTILSSLRLKFDLPTSKLRPIIV